MIELPDGVMLEMEWKQVKYHNHNKYITFQIIPMMQERDIVLIPNKDNWEMIKSMFSYDERDEIIFLLERIAWKRNLKVIELDIKPLVNSDLYVENGMLEATEGYKKLSRENLFEPTTNLTDVQVKSLYCMLEEKFA